MSWKPYSTRVVPLVTGSVELAVYSLAPHGYGFPDAILSFLQYARELPDGRPENASRALEYANTQKYHTRKLADIVEQGMAGGHPDAIVELPSTRNFNKPYTAEIRRRFPDARNLPPIVGRHWKVRSAESASFEEVLADTFIISDNDGLDTLKTVLLVDDILGEGKTVAAIVARLREAGLSSTAHIVLAVPLVIYKPPPVG
jgi:hypothetical protein